MVAPTVKRMYHVDKPFLSSLTGNSDMLEKQKTRLFRIGMTLTVLIIGYSSDSADFAGEDDGTG